MLALTIHVSTFWAGFLVGVLVTLVSIVVLALMYGEKP